MPRRLSKKGKQQDIVVIDPTHLTKEGLLVLQQYVDHGQRLPTVSAKTSYKDIWRHTKKLHAARKTMSSLATKISLASRQASEIYCSAVFELPEEQLHAFVAGQSGSLDDLLDDCDEISKLLSDLAAHGEHHLTKLQAEVTRVKVATNSKERRDLLLEFTRAIPIISCVGDVLNNLTDSLKAIRNELDNLEDHSDAVIHRIRSAWEVAFTSGVQLLIQ
ncbi:hypothetical protein DFH09DRAFT_1433978 [Mycena vulgaris]|nr:hypothetical protein DFH09DRAFT_1433978 [Mycena vulgaris]